MIVMHLMSTNGFSGAENVACQIINSFKKNDKYEKMIYVSEIDTNEKMLKDRFITYYKLTKFNFKNVKKAVKEIKPDIIHAHDIKASIIASMFANNVKVISHVHANHENMRKMCLKPILYNLISSRLDKIIWVSQSALDNYVFNKNVKNKSLVLYNAINKEELIQKIKNDSNEYKNYDLIYLGRLTYQKNPLRLMAIVKKLSEQIKDIRVAIVGNGDLVSDVKQYIKDNKLENNVDLFGFVNNPYKILNSSKIMIMTSRYEGTPMCALEAMALGKPIISTPTDGMMDIIINDTNGYICDDDDEIVEIIVNLLKDEKKLDKMSETALKKFEEKIDINKYVKIIDEIYASCLTEGDVKNAPN